MKTKRKFTENMEWYVLIHEFNGDKIVLWNIFNSVKFSRGIEEALARYTDFESFKEKVKNEAMFAFWSKSEYEIIVGGLFSKYPEKFEKLDVYCQLKNNIDILARYIVTEANKRKRKKYEM